MFAFSKVTSLLFGIVLIVVTSFLIIVTVNIYNVRKIASDKAEVKRILKETQAKNEFKQFVYQTYTEESYDSGLTSLIDQKDFEKIVIESSSDEEFDQFVDQSVDSFYSWLEGDSQEINLSTSDQTGIIDSEEIKSELRKKVGPVSEFIDYDAVESKLAKSIPLLSFVDDGIEKIPEIYQGMDKSIKTVGLITVALLLFVLFSAKSLRHGITLASVILIISGLGLYYIGNGSADKYLSQNDFSVLEQFKQTKSSLPSFASTLMEDGWDRNKAQNQLESYLLFTVGGVGIIGSQLRVQEKEVDDEDDDKEE